MQGDTIRGFKKHKAAHILSEPGHVDISADVNFKACAQVGREQGARVQGPITQVGRSDTLSSPALYLQACGCNDCQCLIVCNVG